MGLQHRILCRVYDIPQEASLPYNILVILLQGYVVSLCKLTLDRETYNSDFWVLIIYGN